MRDPTTGPIPVPRPNTDVSAHDIVFGREVND
jgi:hypothetical protein